LYFIDLSSTFVCFSWQRKTLRQLPARGAGPPATAQGEAAPGLHLLFHFTQTIPERYARGKYLFIILSDSKAREINHSSFTYALQFPSPRATDGNAKRVQFVVHLLVPAKLAHVGG